jgi:hypothetical protein
VRLFTPSGVARNADCFALLGVVLLVAILLVALLKKGAASGAGAH